MKIGKRIIKELKKRVPILPFHKKWIEEAFEEDVQIAALSIPRGNAKSWMIGHLAGQTLKPDSILFEKGMEHLVVSGSREQSRIIMSFIREALDQFPNRSEYRIHDSPQRAWVTHLKTQTKVRVLSSSGKRAFGLVNFKFIFCDEPASWGTREGALLWDALKTSLGKKPNQKILAIGTKSPAEPDTWWPQLLDHGPQTEGHHVTVLSADPDAPWDSFRTLAKVNPLLRHNPDLKKTILRERNEARKNPHLRGTFEAFRLNRHVATDTLPLVQMEDWQKVEKRPVPSREGNPIVGIDLGSSRSWSAAWCLWKNGRSEVFALCPGIPDLAVRERQDAVPRGFYTRLKDDGVLILEEDKRIARPATLFAHLEQQGIVPDTIYSDRFILHELEDVVGGRFPIVGRSARWSQSTEDITGFRKLALDGPLSVVPESRGLVRLSLAKAVLKSDEQGSAFLKKRRQESSRDDVVQAGVLVSGALSRILQREQTQEEQDEPNRPVHRVCKAAA